jgi:nicotinate dehydrogenase subunit A
MPAFHLNGQPCSLKADSDTGADTALLDVLRDECGLSGPKFGCGQGECGACMVLVDGQPQTACNLPLWAVGDRQVTTLEGLGTPEQPHPLQTAFCEERAAQCGYCVAGILTSAAALLKREPHPSREAIVQALDKHLCRCGAHNRMIRAVQRAATTMASHAASAAATPPSLPSGSPTP